MKHNILVVVDVQNDFITGILGTAEARATVPNIVKKIDNFNGEVIYATRDTHHEDYLNTPEGKKLPYVHCVEFTDGWNIESAVEEALGRAVSRGIEVVYVDKPTFGSKDLVNYIVGRTKGEETDIELIGFCTDICVLSNAIHLKEETYAYAEIYVDAACCAGVSPTTHEHALSSMNSCQINITNWKN